MANKFCKKQRQAFSDHLDGQPLSLWRRFAVRWHLATCPYCIRTHQSLVATRDALQALKDFEPK